MDFSGFIKQNAQYKVFTLSKYFLINVDIGRVVFHFYNYEIIDFEFCGSHIITTYTLQVIGQVHIWYKIEMISILLLVVPTRTLISPYSP